MTMSDEQLIDLYNQLIEFGYDKSVATELVEFKKENIENINTLRGLIDHGRFIPLEEFKEDFKKGETVLSKLWDLGFNTRNYSIVIDVMCYTFNGKRRCGKVIYGSERLDEEYLKMTHNGVNVATEEARYHKDRDTLAIMRGNKKQ